MTEVQLIADRLNALPCLRGKLREPIDASDCVQILIAISQVKEESSEKELRSVESEQQKA